MARKWNGGFVNDENDLRRIVEERTPQYEYVGGYTGSEGSMVIRCKTCGTEVTRSIISIRHGHLKCQECERIEREERKRQERERQRREREEQKRIARLMRPTVQSSFDVCPICNGVFVPEHRRQKYCSEECARKKANHKDRRKKLRALMVDRDITLEGLYRRDNGVCYLCGGRCDWNDMEYRANGVKIAGGWYPSIEHVMPISKGGLHSWDNIKLAHRKCNIAKRDAV